ncbi:MAG: phytanoyl-CoA dioxygenase [Osedax symbiont Rs1]|nr:MAG: phytanoyl-CoA dioxygenase [Osedax symbiont Rs1]
MAINQTGGAKLKGLAMNIEQKQIVTKQQVELYQTEGVVVLRGVFKSWIERLNEGADQNMQQLSTRAITHKSKNYRGRFVEDFCNWQRIDAFREFVWQSDMAAIAAQLMQSQKVQFFHDHYLDKEAVSGVATPWHQDMPYYFVDAQQSVSFWIPLDPRTREVSLKSVVGSHLWPKLIMPTSWANQQNFYPDQDDFMAMPDIDNGDYQIRAWAIEPGDVVAFNFKTVHGANSNTVPSRNRTVSFRLIGDDARYVQRPGRTSPSYPDINQQDGQKLREDWFPIIYPR